jgi:hypothetical protein
MTKLMQLGLVTRETRNIQFGAKKDGTDGSQVFLLYSGGKCLGPYIALATERTAPSGVLSVWKNSKCTQPL